MALALAAPCARAEEGSGPSEPPPDTETRASEIFPFTLGQKVSVQRDFGTWRVLTISVLRRRQALFTQAEIRNNDQRQVFPRLRIMLYSQGSYLASCFIPPRSDPYQEIEPGRTRVFTGTIASFVVLPRGASPDALRLDEVPEMHGVTSQEGVPLDEAQASGRPVWKLHIENQVAAMCMERTKRGFNFLGEDNQKYIRLFNNELFTDKTLPFARLDREALKQAKAQRGRK